MNPNPMPIKTQEELSLILLTYFLAVDQLSLLAGLLFYFFSEDLSAEKC